MMLKELKSKLAELEALRAAADEAERVYTENYEDAEAEAAFDAAYDKQWAAMMECVRLVEVISGGLIDTKTARAMVTTKAAELVEILGRVA